MIIKRKMEEYKELEGTIGHVIRIDKEKQRPISILGRNYLKLQEKYFPHEEAINEWKGEERKLFSKKFDDYRSKYKKSKDRLINLALEEGERLFEGCNSEFLKTEKVFKKASEEYYGRGTNYVIDNVISKGAIYLVPKFMYKQDSIIYETQALTELFGLYFESSGHKEKGSLDILMKRSCLKNIGIQLKRIVEEKFPKQKAYQNLKHFEDSEGLESEDFEIFLYAREPCLNGSWSDYLTSIKKEDIIKLPFKQKNGKFNRV